jgi:large subunit ribosomal protein L31
MKADIHPEYNEVTVTCACGNKFTTRSTKKGNISIDICSVCHPFFTGKMKFVDTTGRVERFRKKFNWDERKKQGGAKEAEAPK